MAYKKSLLDNGVVLVTEHLPQFAAFSIGVWVAAGARHELPQEMGLSHFLEHMMFKGTSTRSAFEIAQAIDQVGGEFNAFTGREFTCFHLMLLSKHQKFAIEILADVLLNSKFDPQELEQERKVILQEIAMVRDTPEEYLYDAFFEQAFQSHALGRPILGTKKTVASFKRDRVYHYFQKHYASHRMIISVAGNIEHDSIKKLLNKNLKTQKLSRDRKLYNQGRPQLHAGFRFVKRDVEQSHVLIGFKALPVQSPKRYALSLLNTHLGGGMSSRLFQEIREKRGLAYSIYSSSSPFTDTGVEGIYFGASPSDVGTCFDVIAHELNTLREKAVDERTLRILKENIKGTLLMSSDSVDAQMSAMARSEMFFKRHFTLEETCARIDDVKTAEIQKLAREVIKPENLVVTVLGPRHSSGVQRKFIKTLWG